MKARTKNKRRRGRKRLPAQEREPNGRLSRRKASGKARDGVSEAETKKVARNARMRVYELPEGLCERPEAGYVLGRLYLAQHITKAQHEAGNRLAHDYARYYGLTGIPFPSARAQDMFRVRGMPGAYRHEATVAATNKMMSLEGVLGRADTEGRPVTTMVKRVCIQDSDEGVMHGFMLAHLRRGLEALVEHYGIALDDARKSA